MNEEKPKKEFNEIRRAMSEVGSNFDYLFDVLTSLNIAIERNCEGYAEEKMERLKHAAEMICHDVRVAMRRRNKDVELAQKS